MLIVEDLKVHFPVTADGLIVRRRIPLKAVDGVSLELRPGETLGIVGESGCGKSTLVRAILQLIPATDGRVVWMGRQLNGLGKHELRNARREMQIVFQDPLASLDPRMTVGRIIGEPLRTFQPGLRKTEAKHAIEDIMQKVGLDPNMINRYPHEFSGGQCQRIGIARAAILRPKMIICDEPVSALDVSIQAQIINLLMNLQRDFQLSMIFVSHDLSVVRRISQRVMVLYLGRVMELAGRDALYSDARHPYTRALLAAVPRPDPDLAPEPVALDDDVPSPLYPPSGCVFRTRCPHATSICAEETPAIERVSAGHEVACHHWRRF